MPQARGTQTTVAIYEETTYGVDPGTPDGKKLYVVSSALSGSQSLLDSNTLNSTRSRTRPARGNINVSGALPVEIGAENIGTLLKHAMGVNATTGVGPYTHTLTLGSLPVGLMIEHDYGSNISGSGRYEKFNGCRVGSVDLSFPTEGYCTASFDINGAKSTLASAPLDATYTDTGHTPFSSFQATILEGGAAIATVTTCSIKLDNGLDESVYAIGGGGVRRALPEGFASITGSITALFEDATLLNKAINDTSSSLKITLSRGTGLGAAGNESIEFLVQNLVYERTSPGIQGPQGLLVQLPFRGFRSGVDNGMQVIIKNAVATI